MFTAVAFAGAGGSSYCDSAAVGLQILLFLIWCYHYPCYSSLTFPTEILLLLVSATFFYFILVW